MPQRILNAGSFRTFTQPDVGPIATPIYDKNGNWTKCIRHSEPGDVALRQAAVAGKWRIAVRALRDFDFGAEIVLDYRIKIERRTKSRMGYVYRFRSAIQNVEEDEEDK